MLQDDFPDVTISKIRFLESQGLISPERTASGYRKFYEDDIRRLQWVLRQQKERFLPLKVIKAKLDAGEDLVGDAPLGDEGDQPSLFGEADPPPAPVAPRPTETRPPEARPVESRPAEPAAAPVASSHPVNPADLVEGPVPAPSSAASSGDSAAWLAALQEAPRRRQPSRPLDPPIDLAAEAEGSTYTIEQVCEKTGLSREVVDQLVEFGLVQAGRLGGESAFDEAALDVARSAAFFVSKGIEPRHLRSYKLAAELESGLIEQLTLPLLRQRNPASRAQATEAIVELTRVGGELRHALLRQALGGHVRPR